MLDSPLGSRLVSAKMERPFSESPAPWKKIQDFGRACGHVAPAHVEPDPSVQVYFTGGDDGNEFGVATNNLRIKNLVDALELHQRVVVQPREQLWRPERIRGE